MGKYVSVNKMGNQYVIRIEKMPNSYSGYKIRFDEDWGCTKFLSTENRASEKAILTTTYVNDIKVGGVFLITFDKIESKLVKPSYTVILNDTPWVREHIEDIKKQLFEQEAKKVQSIKEREYKKAIETAVVSDNPTSLIKRLISENARKLSSKDLLEIERELMKVKTLRVNYITKNVEKTK